MRSCQNPNCKNPFNPDSHKYCQSCGTQANELFRNRYRVIRRLGEGGFGKTYEAQDAEKFNHPRVIKQFTPQVTGTAAINTATELFKREAEQLYNLGEHHHQIPELIAYFEHGTNLYLVQEFIKGNNLLAELKQKTFNEQQIREFLADLLPVLQYVHEQNVIHRDIKPENIIHRETDGKYVLIDFGGAKQITQTNLARAGTRIYTVGYAPTEQMVGQAVPASDLYALGATCARLLTGCLPLLNQSGDTIDEIYDACNAEWLWRERLKEKGVTVSDELGRILDKLLQHLVKDRYKTAAEVLQDLNVVSRTSATVIRPLPQLTSFEFDVVTVKVEQTSGLFKKNSTKINHQRQPQQAHYFAEDLGNGVILKMVAIPGGKFWMGSPDSNSTKPVSQVKIAFASIPGSGFSMGSPDSNSAKPVHYVKISPFFMAQTQLTQAQWEAVAALPQVNQSLNPDPSYFKGANLPVESVSWNDTVEFFARLSRKTGKNYRLPSEAEWEYACRAGTITSFHFGETITPEVANYGRNHQGTTPVGNFQAANAFGLYDMHGNVWEWCADHWHSNYNGAPSDGTIWSSSDESSRRVTRGGAWRYNSASCGSAYRNNFNAGSCYNRIGFRVVCAWG